MNKTLRDLIYDAALDSPGSWLLEAYWLKRAAEEIDPWQHQEADINSPEGDFRFMMHTYKFLLGLSFENLLKGIIIAQEGTAGIQGKLNPFFATHGIKHLLSQIDETELSISKQEEALLFDLEKYVKWAGRYPLPKRREELFIKKMSNIEYHALLVLWDHLYEHLKRIGWIIKGNGTRLLLSKKGNSDYT